MKTAFGILTALFVALTVTNLALAQEHEGTNSGGGGQGLPTHLQKLALEAYIEIKTNRAQFPEIDPEKMNVLGRLIGDPSVTEPAGIKPATIAEVPTTTQIVDGMTVETDATNNRDEYNPIIKVSSKKYPTLSANRQKVVAIHEFLGLVKLENSMSYPISSRFSMDPVFVQMELLTGTWLPAASVTGSDEIGIQQIKRLSEDSITISHCDRETLEKHRYCWPRNIYVAFYDRRFGGFCTPFKGVATVHCRKAENSQRAFYVIDPFHQFKARLSGKTFLLLKGVVPE